jgi:hypothetical protein
MTCLPQWQEKSAGRVQARDKAQDCEKEDCRKEKAQDPSLNL